MGKALKRQENNNLKKSCTMLAFHGPYSVHDFVTGYGSQEKPRNISLKGGLGQKKKKL